MRYRSAFSLIELLVTVAIIAILSAIAIPLYTNYQLKAQIAKAYIVMSAYTQQLITAYEKTGSFPSSVSYGSFNVPVATWVQVADTQNNVQYIWFNPISRNQVAVQVALPSSIVSKVQGAGGSNIIMFATDNNGSIVYTCGYDHNDLPPSSGLLPANCTATQYVN